ncbi:MAG: leucine--tRNA ligase [Candidatus Pacearchaeota archaeon]|nr:leucine--tRNA ligase [Candidatus Pacearchaeota archaeon]
MEVNFQEIEKKWQKAWEEAKIFQVREEKGKKKFYVLEMFPYPSGTGLHMGHAFNYIIGDVYARFKRMQGYNVLYPMGYDSFGLPAENAAIKQNIHPKEFTEKAIENFIKQQKSLGLSYDWSRMIKTHEPSYYKWDQWIFLQMLKKGLVYRKKALVNWCPECKTALANEQVKNGRCWRHENTEIEIKELEQWFVKITDYAEELYEDIDLLEWPENIKKMQKNWIGKSHGININFKIKGKTWPVFTTRPDTIYGVTFLAISWQHPNLFEIVTKKQKKEVEKFLKKIKSTSQKEIALMEKEGVFTGSFATNPLTKEKIPVYVCNFVLAEYGSGIVMCVPAHDQRDFEFAKKYNLPIKIVIQPENKKLNEKEMKEAYTEEGVLVDSGPFTGLQSKEAREKISDFMEEKKIGKRVVQFRLKDWLISRQRYWGTPIPVIHCKNCGIIPVPEKELPVVLPEKVVFGKGNPLETAKEWLKVKCPKCKKEAKRETDTMDTFVNSSWYFLRYCDPKNDKKIFDKEKVKYWMPIDQYIGGAEHACAHLIYFRFYTKFLRDLGLLEIDEPCVKLFNQGMVHKDGSVMSKSRGNVVLPEEVSKKYGIDAARLFLLSMASPDKDIEWTDKGIEGSYRFLLKVWKYFNKVKIGKSSARLESKYNKTVKEVTNDIENFKYNIAIIKLKELFDSFDEEESKEVLEGFLKMFSVFCPHITEELWHKWNNTFISIEKWPEWKEEKINQQFDEEEKDVEKLIEDINNLVWLLKRKGKTPKKLFVYVLPTDKFYLEFVEKIKKKTNLETFIFLTNDKNKYDPENKAEKAREKKPAIYLE